MKKWQENRNYRKICDDKGEVVDHIITVDGIDVSVPEDVFSAYARMDRRERYLSEDVPAGGQQLSLEQMAEDGVLPDYVGEEMSPSAEDCCLRQEMSSMLLAALLSLEDRDRQLIIALFYNRLSTREYARRLGITQRAVIKRRDRILKDLKKYFETAGERFSLWPALTGRARDGTAQIMTHQERPARKTGGAALGLKAVEIPETCP